MPDVASVSCVTAGGPLTRHGDATTQLMARISTLAFRHGNFHCEIAFPHNCAAVMFAWKLRALYVVWGVSEALLGRLLKVTATDGSV